MNSLQFVLKLVLAFACLALTLLVIYKGQTYVDQQVAARQATNDQPQQAPTDDKSASLLAALQSNERDYASQAEKYENERDTVQEETQKKQTEISRGEQMTQVYSNIVKDIASLAYDQTGAVRNQKLKDLLVRNQINVTVTPSTTPAK